MFVMVFMGQSYNLPTMEGQHQTFVTMPGTEIWLRRAPVDSVGDLQSARIVKDQRHVVLGNKRLRRHVSEGPVMLAYSPAESGGMKRRKGARAHG